MTYTLHDVDTLTTVPEPEQRYRVAVTFYAEGHTLASIPGYTADPHHVIDVTRQVAKTLADQIGAAVHYRCSYQSTSPVDAVGRPWSPGWSSAAGCRRPTEQTHPFQIVGS